MDERKIENEVVTLYILLQNVCEGFNKKLNNKKSNLTLDKKILFLLSENKCCSPDYLIKNLGVAKGNLALCCKKLIEANKIISIPNEQDKRGIFYQITNLGLKEVNEYFEKLKEQNKELFKDCKTKRIKEKLNKVIELLEI